MLPEDEPEPTEWERELGIALMEERARVYQYLKREAAACLAKSYAINNTASAAALEVAAEDILAGRHR